MSEAPPIPWSDPVSLAVLEAVGATILRDADGLQLRVLSRTGIQQRIVALDPAMDFDQVALKAKSLKEEADRYADRERGKLMQGGLAVRARDGVAELGTAHVPPDGRRPMHIAIKWPTLTALRVAAERHDLTVEQALQLAIERLAADAGIPYPIKGLPWLSQHR